jgi:hypothetical protein
MKMVPAELAKRQQYFEELLKLRAKSPSAKMAMVEPARAFIGLTDFLEQGRAVEVGDYLILYDFGPTWYSSKLHLIEELTIRFQRVYNNPVTDAIAALDDIARHIGARAIAVGDTQIGLMTPYYLAAGYSMLGTQLFKEIRYGIPSEDHRSSGAD